MKVVMVCLFVCFFWPHAFPFLSKNHGLMIFKRFTVKGIDEADLKPALILVTKVLVASSIFRELVSS